MEFFERGAEVASTMRGQKLNNGAGDFMRFRSMAEHVDDSDEQTVALFDNKANVSGGRLAEERPDSYAVFIGFGPGRQPFSNCCPGSAVRVRYQYEFIHHALYAGQTQAQAISRTPAIVRALSTSSIPGPLSSITASSPLRPFRSMG